MPQKRMECFRLLLENLAWIEHQFLSGIRDSRKVGSLWGMMRGVGRVRKSINQSWLAKGLGLVLLCWGFKGVQEEIPSARPALFKSGPWHFHQDNASVNNSILVTDYLTKMGIKTVPQPPYSPDLAPCDFRLFPKLLGSRYETIEEMKEAVKKFIDTLTQKEFHECVCLDKWLSFYRASQKFTIWQSFKTEIYNMTKFLSNSPKFSILDLNACTLSTAIWKSHFVPTFIFFMKWLKEGNLFIPPKLVMFFCLM